MNIGKYFKLCNDSHLQDGRQVYRYLKICQKKKTIHYPIYVAFCQDRIDFFYIGDINNKKGKNEVEENKSLKTEFVDTILFSLPFYEGNKTNNDLDWTLDWIAIGEFPYSNKLEIYKSSSLNNEDWYYNNKKVEKSLKWGLEKNELKKENDDKKLFMRELFLDFLFDFNHTGLFKSSPYLSQAKSQLFQNFYFEAISAKADFYYNLYMYNSNENQFKKVLKKTRDNWANILMRSGADKLIYEKPNKDKTNDEFDLFWFQDVEKELYLIYKNTNIDPVDNKNYSLWLANRNNLVSSFNVIFNFKNIHTKFRSKSCQQWLFILSFLFTLITLIFGIKINNIPISLIWYLPTSISILWILEPILLPLFILVFWGLTFFSSWFIGKRKKIIFSLNLSFQLVAFNLIVILFSSWFFVSKSEFILTTSISGNSCIFIFILILTLLFSWAIVYNNERDLRSTARTSRSFIKSIYILVLALFYTYNIGLIAGSIMIRDRLYQDNILKDFWSENVAFSSGNSGIYEGLLDNSKITDTVYLDNDSNVDTSQIIPILKKDELSKTDKSRLFDNLVYLKKRKKSNLLNKVDCEIWGFDFTIYYIPLLLFSDISLSLFIGIFIQIIIQRKSLND